jgi:hypothetical protein
LLLRGGDGLADAEEQGAEAGAGGGEVVADIGG